jgi:two-component system, NarL family, sensor histidine kinase DevS
VEDSLGDIDARGIWESVPDAMLLVDRMGVVRLANLEADRMFGWPEGLTGRTVESLLPATYAAGHAELRTGFHQEPQRRSMGAGLRLEATRGDGTRFPVQISLSPLSADLVIAAVRDVTDMVASEERLVVSARRRILAEDHERIAKDMHDTVIQELFALGMSLQSTVAAIPDPATAGRVESAVDTLDGVIRSIRSLIFDIRRDRTDVDDLRVQVVEIATSLIPSLGFEPSVSFSGPVDRVPAGLHEHVLAAAREGLTNVARHAQATAAAIEVRCADDAVTVIVIDDGVGMPDRPARSSGLANLAERAQRARGLFRVAAHPEGGTTVEWSAPLPA